MNWDIETATKYVTEVRDRLRDGRIDPRHFVMHDVLREYTCGTVGCIAGWMLALRWRDGNVPLNMLTLADSGEGHVEDIVAGVRCENRDRSVGLNRLFFLWYPDGPTPDQACVAIDAWLSGNNDPWNRGER